MGIFQKDSRRGARRAARLLAGGIKNAVAPVRQAALFGSISEGFA